MRKRRTGMRWFQTGSNASRHTTTHKAAVHRGGSISWAVASNCGVVRRRRGRLRISCAGAAVGRQ